MLASLTAERREPLDFPPTCPAFRTVPVATGSAISVAGVAGSQPTRSEQAGSLCWPGDVSTLSNGSSGACSTVAPESPQGLVQESAVPFRWELKVGNSVIAPSTNDPRVTSMRCSFVEPMRAQCGKLCKVVSVGHRTVKLELNGDSWSYDLELFARDHQRFCHEGCPLFPHLKQSASASCNVCKARIPQGGTTMRCATHDYDICSYCCGNPQVAQVGTKVVRGPTWDKQAEDGEPYTEGVVQSSVEGGLFSVQWPSGELKQYRGPPYQDVWPAYDNGLLGKVPPSSESSPSSDLGARLMSAMLEDDRSELLRALLSNKSSIPKASYSRESGFRFVDNMRSIDCDGADKVATCVTTRHATLVTREVVDAPGDFDFCVRVVNVGGKNIGWGVIDEQADGHARLLLGESGLTDKTVGAQSTVERGLVASDGKFLGSAPPVVDGDVLGVRMRGDKCELRRNGRTFYRWEVGRGRFRFAVSMRESGQSVRIVDDAQPEAEAEADDDAMDAGEVEREEEPVGLMTTMFGERFEVDVFDAAVGYHFYQRPASVGAPLFGFEKGGKKVTALTGGKCAAFTRELFQTPCMASFRVKVLKTDSDIFGLGVVDDTPFGYDSHLIGEKNFPNSAGAMFGREAGVMIKEGSASQMLPGVKEGDVVGIDIQEEQFQMKVNEATVLSVKIKGQFRFGIASSAIGQSFEIVDVGVTQENAPAPAAVCSGEGLQIATCKWGDDLRVDAMQKLGESEAFKGRLEGTEVVAKVVKREALSEKANENLVGAVTALSKCQHPNVVTILAVDPDKLCVVSEWCQHGNLAQYLHANPDMGHKARARLALGVCRGMAWLVRQGVVHAGLKMENVLVRDGGTAAVCDFGLTKHAHHDLAKEALPFTAPEAFRGELSEKSDVFAFAVILALTFGAPAVDLPQLMTTHHAQLITELLAGGNTTSFFQKLVTENNLRPPLPETSPASLPPLIERAWHHSPAVRPRFVELIDDLERIAQDQDDA